MTPAAIDRIAHLAATSRAESAFFRIWTRKEACIKALGGGFGCATRSFSVSHDSDRDARRRWHVIGAQTPTGERT